MFEFDPSTSTLRISRINDESENLQLLQFQKASYQKYVAETVYDDIKFLCESLKEKFNLTSVEAEIKVDELFKSGFKREIKKQKNKFYPVNVLFTINGIKQPDWITVLKIPYMEDDGILNINGEYRVMPMQLSASPDISYTAKNSTLSVAFPARNISFIATNSDIVVKYGQSKLSLNKLIRAMLIKEDIDLDLTSYFANAFLKTAVELNAFTAKETILDEVDKLNILDTYQSDAYALGLTRVSLNANLTIDRALNKVLSRPVLNYAEGTIVTKQVLEDLKRNLVNEVYIRAVPNIVGYYLAEDLIIPVIPKDTPNSPLLREMFPQYDKYAYIPEDIGDCPLIVYRDESLSQETIDLLCDIGIREVDCKRTKTGNTITATFEQEIVGNYTCKLGDVYGRNIPAGRSYDEYVYFYNNPNLEPNNPEHLTVHDLIAIYSLSALIKGDETYNDILNKDTGFLKKVSLANEIFSESFRDTVKSFMQQYKNPLNKAFSEGRLTADKFKGFTRMWTSLMWERDYTMLANTTNPIATLAQVNQVVASLGSNEVPEEMRLLAMGYYGKICPYETPAGLKLGITNTKAIGARVNNGILEAPYRRVLKNSRGEITGVAPTITYMSSKQEAKYKIGDYLALKQVNGKYQNNRVLARVPAPNNQVTVETINAYQLDYVNAFCEQHMSPTAALIPFASANDAVRVTYATHMLKQSILVQNSEVPRVYTSMYKDCFNGSNKYVIRAAKDGMVAEIPAGSIVLQYYDGTEEEIEISETSITNESVNFVNFKVKVGDTFKAGDILVDSAISKEGIYSPGMNLLAAYMPTGFNYEDAIDMSEHAAHQFISISADTVKHRIKKSSDYSLRVGRENYYRYVPEGGVITSIHKRSKSDQRRKSQESIVADKTSGILYKIERVQDESKNYEYRCQLLGFNRLHTGDKLAGRHSNKGVNARVRKNSEMPTFKNGRPIEILLNPCGVPSRMNLGQNLEGFLGFVAYLLDIRISTNSFNGATTDDIKLLLNYVWELANNADPRAINMKYSMLPKEIHEIALRRHAAIREWEGCFYPDGTADLWNPVTGKFFENRVTIGMPYILKLEHEVDDKVHARAGLLEEDYSMIYKQPTAGAAHGGGQKMGEMEMCAYAAYGAQELLEETINDLSDNEQEKMNLTMESLGMYEDQDKSKSVPRSVDMFRYYLEAAGIATEDTAHDLTDISRSTSSRRTITDVSKLFAKKKNEENKKGLRAKLSGYRSTEE